MELPADFPAEALRSFDLDALHPDDFVMALLDSLPGAVCSVVKRQRESLRNPPRTIEELLSTLEGHALTQTVARLKQFVDLL